jgi:oxygen-dependent protoporphyrinogen oxidase
MGGNYTAGVAMGRCVEFGVEQGKDLKTYLVGRCRFDYQNPH